jgi:hypothetical protein
VAEIKRINSGGGAAQVMKHLPGKREAQLVKEGRNNPIEIKGLAKDPPNGEAAPKASSKLLRKNLEPKPSLAKYNQLPPAFS